MNRREFFGAAAVMITLPLEAQVRLEPWYEKYAEKGMRFAVKSTKRGFAACEFEKLRKGDVFVIFDEHGKLCDGRWLLAEDDAQPHPTAGCDGNWQVIAKPLDEQVRART